LEKSVARKKEKETSKEEEIGTSKKERPRQKKAGTFLLIVGRMNGFGIRKKDW